MRKVQVLGPGCPKCIQLADNVEAAVAELGGGYEIEKVTDINEILSFGIMMTPGLAIDGQLKVSGKVVTVEQIKELLA